VLYNPIQRELKFAEELKTKVLASDFKTVTPKKIAGGSKISPLKKFGTKLFNAAKNRKKAPKTKEKPIPKFQIGVDCFGKAIFTSINVYNNLNLVEEELVESPSSMNHSATFETLLEPLETLDLAEESVKV
jgi:hypothetical protein